MALGVLNNISAIYAQNNLANTQASLSKTLQQLSSGSRINSGADDAAGLSLSNGLQASATALSQSAKNASEGVDFLQVADGALSQVTSLLNRAVTLATEASNGTLNGSQQKAADSEYQKILAEIDTINSKTQYNGLNVFGQTASSTSVQIYTSDGSSTGSTSYNNTAADVVRADTGTLGLTNSNSVAIAGTLQDGDSTTTDLTSTFSVDDSASTPTPHTITITLTETGDHSYSYSLAADPADIPLGVSIQGGTGTLTFDSATGMFKASSGSTAVMKGAGNSDIAISMDFSGLNYVDSGGTAAAISANNTPAGTTTDLLSAGNAQTALSKITAAITTIAADRGTIGANINTLSAVSNVMTTQSTNTLAAMNDVTATDYGQATSDMSKFKILSQTGIAALAQANQSQQLITKLLQ